MLGDAVSAMAKTSAGGLAHALVLMAILVIIIQAIVIVRRSRARKVQEDPQAPKAGMSRGERLAIKDHTSPSKANQSCFRPAGKPRI